MPTYTYRAKDSALKAIEGSIDADSETAAISLLGSRGVYPITLIETRRGTVTPAARAWRGRRVSARTLAYMTRQLADLLGGGLPLLGALNLLARQTEHAGLQRVIEALAASVRDGRSLSDALGEHPRVFPSLYISLVRAGEVSGSLEQSLSRLAELGEHEAELRSKILSACAYPVFVLCVAIAASTFLVAYVIPKIGEVFAESGQLLPLPTRVLLAVSEGVRSWWWLLLAGGLGLIAALGQWYRTAAGRAVVDHLVISLPGIGGLSRKIETARFARNLGTMVGQGVPVLQALEVASRNVANVIVQRAARQIQEAVREGSSIAAALGRSGQFPVFVSNMVAVGEESGTVDTALLKVSGAYERDVDRTLRTLMSIIEPLLMLVAGGVAMFIVLAMLLPIFQVGTVVQ
jgi:type II secretion system protein F